MQNVVSSGVCFVLSNHGYWCLFEIRMKTIKPLPCHKVVMKVKVNLLSKVVVKTKVFLSAPDFFGRRMGFFKKCNNYLCSFHCRKLVANCAREQDSFAP